MMNWQVILSNAKKRAIGKNIRITVFTNGKQFFSSDKNITDKKGYKHIKPISMTVKR